MKIHSTIKTLAVIAIAFGLLTVFSGGRALFGDAQARAAVGNAVGFVLWLNFLAGFVYVLIGTALWQGRSWAGLGASLLAVTTALVAGAFSLHVINGGAYEMRTVGALVLRFAFWTVLAIMARNKRH